MKIAFHHWLPHESYLHCGHRFAFLQRLHLAKYVCPLVSGTLPLQTLSPAACIAPHTVSPAERCRSLGLSLHYCDSDHHGVTLVTRASIVRLTAKARGSFNLLSFTGPLFANILCKSISTFTTQTPTSSCLINCSGNIWNKSLKMTYWKILWKPWKGIWIELFMVLLLFTRNTVESTVDKFLCVCVSASYCYTAFVEKLK